MHKTHVYSYLNGKIIPNPKTTARIIRALIHLGKFEEVLNLLEPAAKRMRRNYLAFSRWKSQVLERR